MKILCTADWRGSDPTPVVEIAKREKPDIVLHGGNFQGQTVSRLEVLKIGAAVDDLSHDAEFFAIRGELDTFPMLDRQHIYATELQGYRGNGISILLVPTVIASYAIDFLAPMFLESALSSNSVTILLAHGNPINAFEEVQDSTGHQFFPEWAKGWDICVVGGNPTAQHLGENILIPGSIKKTASECSLQFSPDKGVWIWEDGDIRFVNFTRVKSGAIVEKLYA